MFAVRGIAVSFSAFFICYSSLSLVVCLGWRRVWNYSQQRSARHRADLLFLLRIAPVLAATAVTLTLAAPSFLLLEPRAVDEPMGVLPRVCGFCGMTVILAGARNATVALMKLSRAVARWSSESRMIGYRPIKSGKSISVLRTAAIAPPMTAVGILRPRVWLSGAAEFVLTESELQGAIRHEVAHLRRRDNLKKLFLCLAGFPGMAGLDRAWREAAEIAADDAAVSSASEALDLAAALIKLSHLVPLELPAELTMALVYSPAESLNARVERLIAWPERRQVAASRYWYVYTLCAAAAVIATFAASYTELLLRIHTATEWMVR
jgi:beta-lactamase regulating signal transducer with metallopeptidase domain